MVEEVVGYATECFQPVRMRSSLLTNLTNSCPAKTAFSTTRHAAIASGLDRLAYLHQYRKGAQSNLKFPMRSFEGRVY
jgi:hypothetical protein